MLDGARAATSRAASPIVGLEPSCIFGLRDELKTLLPGAGSAALAGAALTFEEFLVRERAAGRWSLPLRNVSLRARARPRPLPPEGVRRDAEPSWRR